MPQRNKYKAWTENSTIPIPYCTLKRWEQQDEGLNDIMHIAGCSGNVPCGNNIGDEGQEDGGINLINHEGRIGESMELGLAGSANDTLHDYDSLQSDSDSMDSNSSLLYEGSHKSVAESVFSVLNLYIKNNLSKSSLKDILSTISDILPDNHRMPKSVYQLFKYVEELGPQIKEIKHYYCINCCLLLNKEEPDVCPACNLNRPARGVFYEIDVLQQVQALFEHRSLASIMEKAPVRISEPNVIKDITDGSEFKRVHANKQRGPYDLTLVLNTDGVALKKSSNADLWLIWGTFAEIPEHLRESFIIVLGVWYDERKPVMNTFLQPLCCKLRKIYDEGGIVWNHPLSNDECTSIISCPLLVCDAPARAQVLNFLNFNGRFGCCLCQIQTRQARRIEGKKSVRVYPFIPEDRTILRTHASILRQGKRSEELERDHIKGVKGQSIISILPGIDLSTCCIPEYMHSVLLGVVRQILCLWFTKPGPWNVKNQVCLIDPFLLSVQPPDVFSRMPRSILQWKKWKAHEFQNWLLFYSVPVMEDYLESRFMQHWLCLVIAIFSLLKKRITFSEIDLAEGLLRLFVRDIDTLYGDRELTYNVHQLIHLPLCVYRWGPLWSNSAFMFESFNGLVSRMVHGARNIGQEIVKNVKISQGFQVLKNNIVERDGASKLVSPNAASPVGQCHSASQLLSQTEMDRLLGMGLEDIEVYYRIKIRNESFTSKSYKHTKTNKFTVSCETDNGEVLYGSIRFFVKSKSDLFVFLDQFSIQHTKRLYHRETQKKVGHILPIQEDGELIILNLRTVSSMVKLVRVGSYMCKRPNLLMKVL